MLRNAVEGFDCSIVSANKKPFADSDMKTFKSLTLHRSTRFESTVGAGLPVISTIDRLLRGGDEIVRIAGSLSGTLGYIMSRIQNGKTRFSDAVQDAKARGYTEPDPRDDLSGTDVARKALIMARRMGLNVSMRDVKIEALFPDSMICLSLEDFMKKLPELDTDMRARVRSVFVDALELKSALEYTLEHRYRTRKIVMHAFDTSRP